MTLREAVEQVRETHPSTYVRAMLRYAARDADAMVAAGERQDIDVALQDCLADLLARSVNQARSEGRTGTIEIVTSGARVQIVGV